MYNAIALNLSIYPFNYLTFYNWKNIIATTKVQNNYFANHSNFQFASFFDGSLSKVIALPTIAISCS